MNEEERISTQEWFTISGAARHLGLDRKTFTKLVHDGEVAIHVFGPQTVRIRRDDLEAFIASRRRGGDGQPTRIRVDPENIKSRCSTHPDELVGAGVA